MSRTYIDVHVLQTVPPSCVNRDDTGSPKSAVYGGVRRARVSSQAWKRATRAMFPDLLDEKDLGLRTKRVVEMVADELAELGVEPTAPDDIAAAVVGATGLKLAKARNSDRQDTEFLVLVSRQQARALASLAADQLRECGGDAVLAVTALGTAEAKKEAKRILGQGNSIDLALFGRMVANDTDLNVDAACQVAHAISVHAAESEFDYFTAVDDLKGRAADLEAAADSGAGMIGTVEFTSATFYRYATLNVHDLARNLGDPGMTRQGIAAFLEAFVRSMPTGKINTFANFTLPEAVVVCLRSDQPVSFVAAFESPVTSRTGHVTAAAEALRDWAEATTQAYGVGPVATWVVGVGAAGDVLQGLGNRTSFADVPGSVADAAVARLAESV